MSLQETPGNSGDEPFFNWKERRNVDIMVREPFPSKKKNFFLGHLSSHTHCGDKQVKQTHCFKLVTWHYISNTHVL